MIERGHGWELRLDEGKGLVNGSTYHLRADVGDQDRAIDGVGSFEPSSRVAATCALCDATTSYPVGGSWAFPWVATARGGFVARVCPGCATGDYLERLRALSEAREGEKTGARKGRRR